MATYDLTITLNFTVEVSDDDADAPWNPEYSEGYPPNLPRLGKQRITDKAKIKKHNEMAADVEDLFSPGIEGENWDQLADAVGAKSAWCCAVEEVVSWGRIE